jgi:hypothetical protein
MDGIDIVPACLGCRNISILSQVRQDASHGALRQVQMVGNLADGVSRVADQVEEDSTVIGKEGPPLVHTPVLEYRLTLLPNHA